MCSVICPLTSLDVGECGMWLIAHKDISFKSQSAVCGIEREAILSFFLRQQKGLGMTLIWATAPGLRSSRH